MMVKSSIRKLGFAGVAALLLISGLATSTLTAQAADNPPGSMTLLQPPAPEALSDLGGISGYINAASGGNINTWLSKQGIDPASAGSIIDQTIPDAAQGKITTNGGTVSLASDAAGVNVGYLVGDALGKDTIAASISNIAIADGHDSDSFVMSQAEYLAWFTGSTWEGSYSDSDSPETDFDFTITWGPNGATVTPDPATADTSPVAKSFQNQVNTKVKQTTVPLTLAQVVAATPQYELSQDMDLPYSYAYAVGTGLTPGGSVSVDLSDVVSNSLLDTLNTSDHTSGALSDIPLATWLSPDIMQAFVAAGGSSGIGQNATTSDFAKVILDNLTSDGTFNEWATNTVIQSIQSILDGINTAGVGYTMEPLSTTSQATLESNTPAVMNMFVQDGFTTMIAQGISSDISLTSTVDPGTVTSLTPTGVTVADTPAEVDTDASTLTLSASTFDVNPNAVCTGDPVVTPESITATATVVDTTGAPVVGAPVTFGVESPLVLDNPTHVTDSDGVATAVITLPTVSAGPATTNVTAHVDFGTGADLSPATLTIAPVYTVSPAPPVLTVVPTETSPVLANGEDSYTASITFLGQCGPDVGRVVDFTVSGSAQLSEPTATSDEQGKVSVTLTDEVPEMVTVTASSEDAPVGDPVTVTFTEVASPTPTPTQSVTQPPTPTPSQSTTTPPTQSPSPTQSVTQPPTQSPSPTQSVTQPPTQSPTPSPSPSHSVTQPPTPTPSQSTTTPPTQSPSPTQSVTQPPTQSPSPTQSVTQPPTQSPTPTPSQSTTTPPTQSPSPTQSVTPPPTQSPSPSVTPPPSPTPSPSAAPVSGTLTLDPAELAGGGTTMAIATIVDASGHPVADVPVTFQIGGNAQFVGDSVVFTDSSGQATALVTTTTLDCGNLGFDVYASFTTGTRLISLTGSPARATIVPPEGACELPVSPPEVTLANARIIAGNAIPLASVQVMSYAGELLGTSRVDMTGYWSIPTPAGTPSQQITANAISGTHAASTSAWLDTDLPAPARIDQANTHEVAGTIGAVEPSATLAVLFPDGTMIRALANSDGSYSVTTPAGMGEGVVTVIVTDPAGNPSSPVTANLVAWVEPPVPVPTVTATVRYDQVQVGGRQTVTGKGFRYLERVTAQFCTTTCTTVGTGYAGFNGQVSISFTVPDTTPLGSYTVTLTGPTSGSASTTFQVIPPTAPPARSCAYLLWWAKWWWLFI